MVAAILDSLLHEWEQHEFQSRVPPLSEAKLMTFLEVAYRYAAPLREATMRALDDVREVYGVRKITFDTPARIVRVEFDASRFKEPVVAGLLRQAGVDLEEKLVLA
jgi:hypothetical protein